MFERRESFRELVPWTQNLTWIHDKPWGQSQDSHKFLDLEDPYNPDPYK